MQKREHALEDTKRSRLPRWMCLKPRSEGKEDVQQDNDFLFVRRDGANIAKKQPWEINHQSSNSETMNTDYLIQGI